MPRPTSCTRRSSAGGTPRPSTCRWTPPGSRSGCSFSTRAGCGCGRRPYNLSVADRQTFDDRQLDAVLERLDGLRAELKQLNQRLDHTEGYLAMAHELRSLNESLQALAYAALGQQGPQVRRRRTG